MSHKKRDRHWVENIRNTLVAPTSEWVTLFQPSAPRTTERTANNQADRTLLRQGVVSLNTVGSRGGAYRNRLAYGIDGKAAQGRCVSVAPERGSQRGVPELHIERAKAWGTRLKRWAEKRRFFDTTLLHICVIGGISLWWCFAITFFDAKSYFAQSEIDFFLNARFEDIFSIMKLGEYQRFSPLGFGLIGYAHYHVIVPVLDFFHTPKPFGNATHMVWFHPLFLIAAMYVTYRAVRSLFQRETLAIAAVLLVGLTDSVFFQMRFVSTLAVYLLQITSILAIYFLVKLAEEGSWRRGIALWLTVVGALAIWEQGLDLAFAIALALGLQILTIRSKGQDPAPLHRLLQFKVLLIVLVTTALYLLIRLPSAAGEALSTNREASYFFSYPSVLAMIDDVLLNASSLSLQAFRQFLPTPPLALSVMFDINMDKYNTYNATYAQFPNMSYRAMGLWYAGLAFGGLIALVIYAVRQILTAEGRLREIALAGLCVLLAGATTHLPIMYRDYFNLPGFALGYKISIGYMGFVVLIILLLHRLSEGEWWKQASERLKRRFAIGGTFLFVLFAIARTVLLNTPTKYPW